MMVVGLIVGPDRIPDVNIVEAMERPGLYAFPDKPATVARRVHAIRQAGGRALALQEVSSSFQEDPQPTIFYPPGLAAERLGGQMFSAPPEMPPQQATIHAAEAALHHEVMAELAGTAVEVQPTAQIPEAIAA